MHGTLRLHQERKYPDRVSGTDHLNPDFAAFARAFGAQGKTADRTEDFPAAFEEALSAETPSLLEPPRRPRRDYAVGSSIRNRASLESLAGVTGGILRKLILLPHPGSGATRRLLRRTNTGFTYFRCFAEVTSWIARNCIAVCGSSELSRTAIDFTTLYKRVPKNTINLRAAKCLS
jgi:hypothetical protein